MTSSLPDNACRSHVSGSVLFVNFIHCLVVVPLFRGGIVIGTSSVVQF